MKKPQYIGPSEPVKTITQEASIYLLDGEAFTSIIEKWNSTYKYHVSANQTIISGPSIDFDFYDKMICLVYTFGFENANYLQEVIEYKAAIALHEQDMALWEEFQKNRELTALNATSEKIDIRIERAERRLANLKATKAGEPLPFPKG